jgi:lactam utilization protein B
LEKALSRLRGILESGTVLAQDGAPLDIVVDAVLVHSDTPNAVKICRAARELMRQLGVSCLPFGGNGD